jgi:hypothetical protein
MKSKYLLSLVIICFFSCNKENVKEEFYPNGGLKLKAQINKSNIFNGLYEEYYETGEIRVKSIYNNGLLIDTIFTYHKNGKIESKGIQKNSLPFGWWAYYNADGRLNEKREILIIDKKPYLNQIMRYDSKGKIDYKSSSFFVLDVKDTLSLGGVIGEIFYHHDTVGYQKRYIRIIVDNQYSESKIKKDTFVGEESKKWFGIYNHKTGNKTVSGIIEEQLIFGGDNKTPSDYTIRTSTKYFQKEIYVKDKE